MAPKAAVGNYFFAYRLAVQPVQMLAGNFSNVLFPAFTRLRAEPQRQLEAALKASKLLAYTAVPYCFLQAALAPSVMRVLFGAKWDGAIVLVQILSIGLAFDAVTWVAGTLLSARGQFQRAFWYSCLFAPPFFVIVAVGAALAGAYGVAIGVSGFYIVMAPIYSYVVFKRTGATLHDIATIYGPPIGFAALAAVAPALIASRLANSLEQMATILVLGFGIYGVLVKVLSPAVYEEVRARLMSLPKTRAAG
jgi:PST family polysaccharide transporter